MVEPFLRTKTYIPTSHPTLVPRLRLIDRLESGFQQGQKLILVSAPAGSGKTTLVSSWIRHSSRPAAWISLDEDDNDLPGFLTLLTTTLKEILPELSETLFALARSSQGAPPRNFLTELINEIDACAPPFVLVLDDYDHIQTPSIHKAITYLIDNRPPAMHVTLVCRGDPPLALSRWRARGQLMELRAADLRFSPDETTLFFRTSVELELSGGDIAVLEANIEGWAAGLQLVALALQSKITSQGSLESDGLPDPHLYLASLVKKNAYIFDYLIDEVYDRQPAAVQSFLLQTSILNRLCASLSAHVVGNQWLTEPVDSSPGRLPATLAVDEAETIIEYLERSNLFLVPLDAERRWFRYHPLFAEALTSYLHKIQPDWSQALNLRASQWYEQNGFFEDAVHHALAGADFERAARLVEQVADQLLWSRGQIHLLLRWVEAIPAEVLLDHPRLSLLQAWLELWSNQIKNVGAPLQAALNALPKDQPSQRIYLAEAAAIQIELARLQGNIPLMLEQAETARQLLAGLPDRTGAVSVILGILAGAYRATGNARESYRLYAEASRTMQVEEKMPPTLIATGYQIQLLAIQGQLAQSLDLYQTIQMWAEQRRVLTYPAFGMVSIQAGEVLREQNRFVEAERLLRDGIRLSLDGEGLADDTFDGFVSLARLLQAAGEIERADTALEHAVQLAQKYHLPDAETQVAVYRARFSMMRGDAEPAARWIEDHGLTAGEEVSYRREHEFLLQARWLIEQDRPGQADQILLPLLVAAEASGRVGRTIEVLELQALAFQHAGNLDQALTSLARAFELGEPAGFVRTFVDEGPRLEKLIRLAVSRGTAVTYASMLLRAFKPATHRQGLNQPGTGVLAEPLTGRELEVLRLISAGLSNREIADEFFVSVGTVKSHINKIYRKLEVTNRVRATTRAKELGLL